MKLHEFGSFWTVYKQTALKGKRRSEQARWNDGKTVRCSNSHNETKPHKQERKEHWERESVCVYERMGVWERAINGSESWTAMLLSAPAPLSTAAAAIVSIYSSERERERKDILLLKLSCAIYTLSEMQKAKWRKSFFIEAKDFFVSKTESSSNLQKLFVVPLSKI